MHRPRQVLSQDNATYISKYVCTFATDSSTNHAVESGQSTITNRSSSFLSFHQESYVRQIVPSQCLAQPMAMSIDVVRYWGEQALSIMGQASRVAWYAWWHSHTYLVRWKIPTLTCSLSIGQPVYETGWVSSRLSSAGMCSSALMLWCKLASMGSRHYLRSSTLAVFAVVLMGSAHLMKLLRDFRRGKTPIWTLSGCI